LAIDGQLKDEKEEQEAVSMESDWRVPKCAVRNVASTATIAKRENLKTDICSQAA
jgi:cytochrome c-type biogenesis protein CcmH/NrfF